MQYMQEDPACRKENVSIARIKDLIVGADLHVRADGKFMPVSKLLAPSRHFKQRLLELGWGSLEDEDLTAINAWTAVCFCFVACGK